MQTYIKRAKAQTFIAAIIVTAVLVLLLVDLATGWSSNFGRAFADSFSNIGNVFRFSTWSSLSSFNIVTNFFVLLTIGFGTLIFIVWLASAIKRDWLFGFFGAILHAFLCVSVILYASNSVPEYNHRISINDGMTIAILVMLCLGIIALTILLFMSLRVMLYEAKQKTVIIQNIERSHTEEKHESSVTESTVIINNYYTNETAEVVETHDYVEEAILTPVVVATEVSARAPRKPFALKLEEADENIRDI